MGTIDFIPQAAAADDSVPIEDSQASIAMDERPLDASDPCLSLHRPRKRLRRIVSAFAQTATAVTVGALVTWSALAFT
jgi:hypothetical protein